MYISMRMSYGLDSTRTRMTSSDRSRPGDHSRLLKDHGVIGDLFGIVVDDEDW
jgi:hypothetical protein